MIDSALTYSLRYIDLGHQFQGSSRLISDSPTESLQFAMHLWSIQNERHEIQNYSNLVNPCSKISSAFIDTR